MFKKNVDIRYIIVLLFVSLSLEYSLVEVAWMITKFLFDFLKNWRGYGKIEKEWWCIWNKHNSRALAGVDTPMF